MSPTASPPEFIPVDGTPIACRRQPGDSPGVVWLGGFRSDMRGIKAETLATFTRDQDLAFLRHDYSGHGESGGDFADGTISRWLSQSLAVFDAMTSGPQILVGSSMGGWIALRMMQEMAKRDEKARIAGLVLIAPAPDFTSDLAGPRLTDDQKALLDTDGFFTAPSAYDDGPYVFTRALFDDGETNRVLTGPIDTFCPVHILQGMQDPDVPHTHALRLMEHLPADDVTLTLVKDGDHRLSRPQDLALLTRTVGAMARRIRGESE